MSNILTIDKKLFCKDRELLKDAMREEGFIFKNSERRTDEYLSDMDSYTIDENYGFVLSRINNKDMKLYYPLGVKENKIIENLSLDIIEHQKIIDLFSSLGYYKYITADILKETYIKKEKEIIYHIIIETVNGIGNFIELEVIADSKDEEIGKEKIDELKNKLLKVSLIEIEKPIPSIIASEMYEKDFRRAKLSKILVEIEKIVENIDKMPMEKALLNTKTFINLELIKKIEELGIEVVIVSSRKDKEEIDLIKERIGQLGYNSQLIDIHDIKEISVRETVIIEKQKRYDFSEVALIILNHINR